MARDWVTFYFLDPHPERFVAEVRQMVARGDLTHPERSVVLTTFLSRVMAANRAQVRGWLEALSDLPSADLRALDAAVWLAGIPLGDVGRESQSLEAAFAQPPPDMLERRIDSALALDVLWADYFATGDLRAVRKIISVLEYMSDYGAAQAYRGSAQTDADRQRAVRDGMFQAASWSIGSLMREHPPLKLFCGDLVRSGDLSPTERTALALILSKEEPDRWRVDIDAKTGKVSIAWTDTGAPAAPPKGQPQ